MRVHVLGAGKMGLPMARHLREGGHALSVSDPDEERLRLARDAQLMVQDAASGIGEAEVVLSSLPNDAALLAVAQQVARHAQRGATWIDTSTVSPTASAEASKACTEAGVRHLRATVSGNNHMAEAAQLTVMVSGPRESYDAMLPLLRLLGPTQFWLGEGEQARLMKLVVNLMIAQTSAMLAEALALGRKGGLDWHDMFAVLTASAVASPILKAKAVQLAERDYTPTFTVEQMRKDLGLILHAAAVANVPLPQTAGTLQLMQAASAQGLGGEDYAAIIRCVARAAGLED
jgi:3-hydroxyisobutyrate dehydrogenase-like beta-hydroxyacid dehydrogenase